MKTTTKHFEIFEKECRKWVDYFELNNYSIRFEVTKLAETEFAECNYDIGAASSMIGLCSNWDTSIRGLSEEQIKKYAKHEVIHLLLARFSAQAYERFINKNELKEAEEELVRKLENIIK